MSQRSHPLILSSAEKLQYERFQRRDETNAPIPSMSKEGATTKQIIRRAGYSRGLVRKVLRGRRSDIFRVRSSSLEAYLPWLDEQWAAGRRNGAELWRSLKSRGFRGCPRVVSEWSGRRRRSERMDASALGRAPSARTVARRMTVGRDQLSKAETVTVAAIESGVESLVQAREAAAAFQTMIRQKALAELGPWIERAKTALVASFANGVTKDIAAVTAAISSGGSNGQTEGQICKLKLVKRQM
jgi:transposase